MRYTTSGPVWASGRYVGPALTPPYVSEGQAGISYGPVTFRPGNEAIPVGHSNVDQGLVGLALTGYSRSSDAPDYFTPRHGHEVATERADVHTRSSIIAPIPSTPPARIQTVRQQFVPRLGGLSQLGQPQTVPRWPSLTRGQ